MSDCWITPVGCLKDIITEFLWPPVKRHIDYWLLFDDNIQGLRDGIGDLDRETYDINQKIEEARLRIEKLRPGVEDWAKAGTEKLAEARRILPDDNLPRPWNLISRYSMGKIAKKKVEDIAKLRNDGNFNTISDPAPPPAMGSTSYRSTMDFELRKQMEEDIIESLRNSSVNMIGICGMGGIGKTTMAKKIRKRVKEENLFEEVVMVTVSQQKDMLKIQEEIAELFGLNFNGNNTMSARADKLHTRLMDTKRKIIIFDDVWECVELDHLGVPFESERCKILLTTRSKDVCKKMEAQKIIAMEILNEEESWILFKDKAGDCVADSNLLSLAKDVVAECKGLPIALVTVGKVLQNQKRKSIWVDSLSQLRRSNPADFPEVLKHVYKPLKLSYDFLHNSEQYLFLLCCLFPEDYDIPIKLLTWYSMGLRLFNDITNIEETRNRTFRLVENLKNRFLLIDADDKIEVKMHDVVRDVAIYIGSTKKDGSLKSLHRTSIENSSDVNCNWMSVDISNEQMDVPVLSQFPNLRLLMLSSSEFYDISHVTFEGMEELNVLSFQSISIGSLPPTLGLLENLQTLCLFDCEVENISVIGKLASLKILSCCGCKNITELPAEIGRLKDLRLLELDECSNLQRIPFGIISSLFLLEELKIRRSFSEWEPEENGNERKNATLTELGSLLNLTCLEIEIDDCTLSAQEICLSRNLVKYYIRIGSDNDYYFEERDYEKVMNISLPSHIGAVGKWIQMQVRNTEWLFLKGDGSGSNNFNIAKSENLRTFRVRNCSTLKRLVETKDCKFGIVFPLLETLDLWSLPELEDICDRNQNVSFCNLKSIVISSCPKLRSLFSVLVARTSLLQLEVLEIRDCDKLEEVFWNEVRDGNTDDCIEFPKLWALRFYNLPNLTAFCQGLENMMIKFPNLTQMCIEALPKLNSLAPLNSRHDQSTCFHFVCNPKVEMDGLKILSLTCSKDTNIRNIWCHQIPNNIFNNLETLDISFMNGRSLMSTSIAKNLVSLKCLRIIDCREMVEVIENDDDYKQVVDINGLFSTLRELSIWNLFTLRRFWQWNQALKLPLLEVVNIYNCPVMETFTLGSINTPNIRRISINFHEIGDSKDLNHVIKQDFESKQVRAQN